MGIGKGIAIAGMWLGVAAAMGLALFFGDGERLAAALGPFGFLCAAIATAGITVLPNK